MAENHLNNLREVPHDIGLVTNKNLACQYITICKDLDCALAFDVLCEPRTVRTWICTSDTPHTMQLCNRHANYYKRLCPYHPDKPINWKARRHH